MNDQYYLDLKAFTLKQFKNILKSEELLPSRRILKERIDERFEKLESMGIKNLEELIDTLKSKKKIEAFSDDSGISAEYLTILKRQTNIYTPKPIALKDLPGISPEHSERLAAIGIKQTRQLFGKAKTKQDRQTLAQESNVPEEVLLELAMLSDLARAGWVGPIFARLMYEAGAKNLEELAASSPEELFERTQQVNQEQQLTKARFTARDIELCREFAQKLPKVIC